jgi:hypothetical protein
MLDALKDVSWLAVLLADVLAFVLGGVWFAVLFARVYAVALGREGEPPGKPGLLFVLGPLVCNTVGIVTSALLLRALHVHTFADALGFGAVVGLGYLASTTINTGINPNIPRPFVYAAVSGLYFFVTGVATSLVLVAVSR